MQWRQAHYVSDRFRMQINNGAAVKYRALWSIGAFSDAFNKKQGLTCAIRWHLLIVNECCIAMVSKVFGYNFLL